VLHLLTGRLILEVREMIENNNKILYEISLAIRRRLKPIYGRGLPLITVCIPTRNEERFIGQALYAIRRVNLYPNVEIVVADQESTDNTMAIAKNIRC
jgi:cellulose synthase/poly-beta-1,6-N-acetylglucosamine synthase-like glycosyltransferase